MTTERKPSIAALYPEARRVRLAGLDFDVDEIRIMDIADLQRWLEGRSVRPLDAIRDKIDDPSAPGREAALWAAYDVLRGPGIEWGSPEANRAFRTPDGIEEQARVILRWHHPEVAEHRDTLRALMDMVSRSNPLEYWEMVREWRRRDPLDEVKLLLGIDDREGGTISFPEAIFEVVELTGWDLDRIARLHVSQFNIIRARGTIPEGGMSVTPGTGDLKRVVRERRARWKRQRGED